MKRGTDKNPRHAGFTLLEMIVAIGIFSILMILAIGITLGVSGGQRKAANIAAVLDNIRFSLELMTREMRTGTEFALVAKCGSPANGIEFVDENISPRQRRFYYLQGGTIMRVAPLNDNPIGAAECAQAQPFTAEEVSIEHLNFLLNGQQIDAQQTPDNKDGQPWLTIALKIKSKDPKTELDTTMHLQTTVVPRLRDL